MTEREFAFAFGLVALALIINGWPQWAWLPTGLAGYVLGRADGKEHSR